MGREPWFPAVHEVAALLLARSNNTEDAMGEYIPQAVYDSLYERKLLTLGSDISGESWAMTTDAGDAYLRAALTDERCANCGEPFIDGVCQTMECGFEGQHVTASRPANSHPVSTTTAVDSEGEA